METPKRKSANDSGRKHQIVKKLSGRVMFDSKTGAGTSQSPIEAALRVSCLMM